MPETRVIVQFIETGKATELLLTHQDLPEIPICLQHRSGWIEALERVERALSYVSTLESSSRCF